MERHNVSIAGAGKIAGGEYGDVRIAGAGRIDGDITAEDLSISGSGKVQGNTKAREITVSGAAKFAGRVEADTLKASGSCGIEKDAEVKELRSSGSQRIEGNLKAHYVKTSGSLEVKGDLEADVFVAAGRFEIGGLLSADRIEARLEGTSRAREIGGEKIEIRRGSAWGVGFFHLRFGAGSLEAEVVEGDEVSLEATKADVVRGKKVQIGPGCRIRRVEYQESLDVHPEAEVGERIKG